MFYQDDPKKCTAAKMVKFGLAKNIKKIGSKGLVLDPFCDKTLLPKDRSVVNLQVVSESGICIIGPDADCLVSESTRKPGQIFDVVQVDGLELNVRYSGPDVRLEKFSILPKSSDEFLPNVNWNIEVIKNDEISRLYYKITYKTLE